MRFSALPLMVVFLAGLSGPAWSAPADKPAAKVSEKVRSWFKNWKEGLSRTAVHGYRQNRRAVAVAAVRGEKQKLDDPEVPYMKGSVGSKEAAQSRKEAAELSAAVDLILAGDVEGGSKKLEEFEAKHPKSSLLKDVAEARQMLKTPAEAKGT